MGGFGWGGYLLGGLLMLLFWGGIITLAFVAVRAVLNSGNKPDSKSGMDSPHALGILKERYARGEIDREEFQRMKDDLEA
jgi:putative membrane protein